ncbi:MAG: hypothetical protein SH857_04955 [Chitinophagales bacterium]|nr:hypothetical protein [Chitinophagales bacterium]
MKKKRAAKKKTKVVKGVAKKAKSAAKKKATSVAVKKVKSVVKKKATNVVKAKTMKPVKAKVIVKKTALPKSLTPDSELHFMPEQGMTSPVTSFEARQAENIFHHKEEVALHQENEKVKEAMSSRKSVKSSYHRGRGPR